MHPGATTIDEHPGAVIRRRLRACLGALLIAAVGGGGAYAAGAEAAGSTSAAVERFVMAKPQLPPGYTLETRRRYSPRFCPGTISTGAVKQQLTALGFRGCAAAVFTKEVDQGGGLSYSHHPESVAILMRSERAASSALRVLRRMLRDRFPSELGFQAHSLPAPRLGDEAPRGLAFTVSDAHMFTYLWRRGSVVAWTSAADILGDFDAPRLLKLAGAVDARGAR